MITVFLSYRRQDSADICDRIANHLQWKYGKSHIFRDVSTILAGSNFDRSIRRALEECHVVLVVIGPQWLEIRDAAGQRRLDDPADYVRMEVATALRTGKTVIPVLVRGARMPSAQELPPDLVPLAQHPPIHVRPDPAFRADMERLYHAMGIEAGWRPASWPVLVAASVMTLGFILEYLVGLVYHPISDAGGYMGILAFLAAVPLSLAHVIRTGGWPWLGAVAGAVLGIVFWTVMYEQPGSLILLSFVGLIAACSLLLVMGLVGPTRRRGNLDPRSALAWRRVARDALGFATLAVIGNAIYFTVTIIGFHQAPLFVLLWSLVVLAQLVGAGTVLTRSARLGQWGWFAGLLASLLVFLGSALLAYFLPGSTDEIAWLIGLAFPLAQGYMLLAAYALYATSRARAAEAVLFAPAATPVAVAAPPGVAAMPISREG